MITGRTINSMKEKTLGKMEHDHSLLLRRMGLTQPRQAILIYGTQR